VPLIFALVRAFFRARRQIWAIARLPIAIGLLLSMTLPLPTHSDTIACPVQARLSVGGIARVAYTLAITPSVGRPLRDYPSVGAPLIQDLPPGAPLSVRQGPTCAASVRWWQVQPLIGSPSAPVGWMAETDADNTYTLEPWQVLIDYAQPTQNGAAVLRINAQGAARWLIADPIAPIDSEGLRQFPAAEADPLVTAYAAAYVTCPDRAQWIDPSPDQQLSVYRSPDSTRVLVVRHLWRAVEGCDGSITQRYGIDRLSLIAPDGERTLFDVPLHARLSDLPSAIDRPIPPDHFSQITAIAWSPDNIHAVAWLSYRSAGALPLTQLLLIDVVRGTLHDLDSGFAPVWNADGSRLTWLRADGEALNLIDATPDNLDRQTRTLPANLKPLTAPIAPTWNADGTRLISCMRNAADPVDNSCSAVVVVDVPGHHVLPPLTIPLYSAAVRWIMADQTLLWLPDTHNEHPTRLSIQPIADRVPAAMIALPQTFDIPHAAPSDQVIDAVSFPDGFHVLIVVRSADGGLHYWVFDVTTGAFQSVQFTA